MRNVPSNADSAENSAQAKSQPGSQTLLRGLDVIEAVVDGPIPLAELAQKLGLTRSTTHRLATALIDRRYLSFTPRLGYHFGPKLLELGFQAQRQTDVVHVARPHLEALAAKVDVPVARPCRSMAPAGFRGKERQPLRRRRRERLRRPPTCCMIRRRKW